MPIDEDLGLSEREKELKRWNAPYVYREFPKMLYRGTTTTAGRFTLEDRTVANEAEETLAADYGWMPNPERAREVEVRRQEAVGVAAAERAWADRQMSASAQVEAAQADAASARHVPEVKRRPARSHKKKPPPPEPAL